jgi:DNA mismatch repair protein MutL
LLDQHAAHEKIIFERLVARHRRHLAEGELLVQDLLVPAVVDLGRREMQTVTAEEAQLARLGFVLTPMGANSVAIRSIPDTGERRLDPEPALRQALAALQQDILQADDAIEEFFYQMACKAAVKANDLLDESQIRQLLLDLARLDDPYHCPHGRPVIISMTKYELEKRFRRIV